MKGFLFILVCFIVTRSNSQEKKLSLRLYLSPAICISPTQHRVFNDGKVTLTNLTKSSGLFFGGGLELLKPLIENWSVGGDLGFISKGYFTIKDTIYYNGTFGGAGFTRTDLFFFETKIFVEKQLILKNPDYKIMFSAGLFYGLPVPSILDFRLESKGSDFGASLSLGIKRKHSFATLMYEKGLINVGNNFNSTFKTNSIAIKIGYVIL